MTMSQKTPLFNRFSIIGSGQKKPDEKAQKVISDIRKEKQLFSLAQEYAKFRSKPAAQKVKILNDCAARLKDIALDQLLPICQQIPVEKLNEIADQELLPLLKILVEEMKVAGDSFLRLISSESATDEKDDKAAEIDAFHKKVVAILGKEIFTNNDKYNEILDLIYGKMPAKPHVKFSAASDKRLSSITHDNSGCEFYLRQELPDTKDEKNERYRDSFIFIKSEPLNNSQLYYIRPSGETVLITLDDISQFETSRKKIMGDKISIHLSNIQINKLISAHSSFKYDGNATRASRMLQPVTGGALLNAETLAEEDAPSDSDEDEILPVRSVNESKTERPRSKSTVEKNAKAIADYQGIVANIKTITDEITRVAAEPKANSEKIPALLSQAEKLQKIVTEQLARQCQWVKLVPPFSELAEAKEFIPFISQELPKQVHALFDHVIALEAKSDDVSKCLDFCLKIVACSIYSGYNIKANSIKLRDKFKLYQSKSAIAKDKPTANPDKRRSNSESDISRLKAFQAQTPKILQPSNRTIVGAIPTKYEQEQSVADAKTTSTAHVRSRESVFEPPIGGITPVNASANVVTARTRPRSQDNDAPLPGGVAVFNSPLANRSRAATLSNSRKELIQEYRLGDDNPENWQPYESSENSSQQQQLSSTSAANTGAASQNANLPATRDNLFAEQDQWPEFHESGTDSATAETVTSVTHTLPVLTN